MAFTEEEARKLVIDAGHRLLESGLIARTWGNISARITEDTFVITPSGLAYDTLRPEQLVKVHLPDGAYEGSMKPSSEKGIHAEVYGLRPDVRCIIHTHQLYASAIGVEERELATAGDPVLGDRVPCAAYGMPSTKKLRQGVIRALQARPGATAVLMPHHGALCLGQTMDRAFEAAAALETRCKVRYEQAVPAAEAMAPDWGSSKRGQDSFVLTCSGSDASYSLASLPVDVPLAAKLHREIYERFPQVRVILHEADPDVTTVSGWGTPLPPLLDDLVQIAGVTVRCAAPEAGMPAGALRGRNAVLLYGAGAFCTGSDWEDADAVRTILRKSCKAARYGASLPDCRSLGKVDAWVQRTIYLKKYAKKKFENPT